MINFFFKKKKKIKEISKKPNHFVHLTRALRSTWVATAATDQSSLGQSTKSANVCTLVCTYAYVCASLSPRVYAYVCVCVRLTLALWFCFARRLLTFFITHEKSWATKERERATACRPPPTTRSLTMLWGRGRGQAHKTRWKQDENKYVCMYICIVSRQSGLFLTKTKIKQS